jgi:restriction endonuclease Mrr
MNAQHFLERIEAAGFNLEPHGDFDIAITPLSRLTDTQRQFIKTHKTAIRAALAAKPSAPILSTAEVHGDTDILTHPECYEIVEFTDWRLPSGRRVTFKLAIPKEKYDGFELLRLLDIQGQ